KVSMALLRAIFVTSTWRYLRTSNTPAHFLAEPGQLLGFSQIHSSNRTVLPLVLAASVCQLQIRLIPSRSWIRLCPMARLSPPELVSSALTTQAPLQPRPRSATFSLMPEFAV